METIDRHRQHARAVRTAVTNASGVTEASLRAAVLARAAGGPPADEPYDTLARQIERAASRVTDVQVAAVRGAAGSEKGAFEVIMSASIGAGLARWDAAVRAIDEASHAPA